jgi:hypothetical protein
LAPIDDLVSEPARVSVRLSAQGIMNILEWNVEVIITWKHASPFLFACYMILNSVPLNDLKKKFPKK